MVWEQMSTDKLIPFVSSPMKIWFNMWHLIQNPRMISIRIENMRKVRINRLWNVKTDLKSSSLTCPSFCEKTVTEGTLLHVVGSSGWRAVDDCSSSQALSGNTGCGSPPVSPGFRRWRCAFPAGPAAGQRAPSQGNSCQWCTAENAHIPAPLLPSHLRCGVVYCKTVKVDN